MAGLNDFLDDGGGDAGQAEAEEPSVAVETVPVVEGKEPPQPAPVVEPEPPDEIPEDLRGTREALIAERAKRKDWKGQAERASGELTALRAELEAARKVAAAAPPPPAPVVPAPEPRQDMAVPNPVEDPQGYHEYNQRMLFNERLNLSEAMIRDKHEDVDEKLAVFKKAAEANPALRAELTRQPHPYAWMYSQAQRIMALAEVGDDPTAFRARIEAEIRAKVEAEYAAAGNGAAPIRQTPTVNIPRSLGTAPSSAPRSLQAVDTVPEFADIFTPKKRRA
jgi:hypothetical protein